MPTSEELLKQANIALQKAVDEKNNRKLESDRKFILAGIGKDLNQALKPTLTQIARDNASVAREAISEMKRAKMPDVVIPPIDIPKPQIDVNVDLSSLKVPQPKISVSPILRPDITFPKEMDIKGWVQLQGVDLGHPLPVQLRDADGRPVNLFENLTTLVGGSGGGIAKIVKISDVLKTIDVNVTGATGSMAASIIDSSGVQYSGSNPLPVVFGAGATTGSNVVDSSGVAYSGSNPFPITGNVAVSGITGTIGANIVDSGGEAYTTTNPLPVDGDFYPATQPISAAALPLPAGAATSALQLPDGHNVTIDNAGGGAAVNIQDGGNTITVGGTVAVSGIAGTLGANIVDSSGQAYTTTNPLPIDDAGGTITVDGTVAVSGVTASVQATIIDSSGVGYSGTNPLPVVFGAATTTGSNIVDSSGVAYSGSNPIPITGTVVVGSSTQTTGANIIDSSGEAYTTTNPLPIGDAGGSVTVDGTFWQATQPVSAASLPLPTGAATSALQLPDGHNVTVDNANGASAVNIQDGGNTITVDGTVVVSSITATTGTNIVDSTGEAYTTTNPVPVNIVSGAGATTAGTILDGDGNYRDTFPISGTVIASGITASVAATIIDSAGAGYSNTNPMTTKIGDGTDTLDLTQTLADNVNATVTLPVAAYNYGYEGGTWDRVGATSGRLNIADGGGEITVDGTVAVSGITASTGTNLLDSGGVGYSGSNPVPIQGLVRPVQVRGSLKTAYVTENEIEEVVLLAGTAAEYHDLIFAMCANESTGAINLDFRQTTGGTVQMSVEVPAEGTAGVSLPVPIPQDHADATWTVQNSAADNSNTVYSVTALFSKET